MSSHNPDLLWLSPNLNHYKARLVDHLHRSGSANVTVLAGTGRSEMGDVPLKGDRFFNLVQLPVSKASFGHSLKVMSWVLRNYERFDHILVPKEFKNILLILFVRLLCFSRNEKGKRINVVSYNHPIHLEGPRKAGFLNRFGTRLLYLFYDRIIFYTEKGKSDMLNNGLISRSRARHTINTIDTSEISDNYQFNLPDRTIPTILFIGRLVPSKRISDCLDYYRKLKSEVDNLRLVVIGDGPEAYMVRQAVQNDSNIEWLGSLVEEYQIAPYMKRAWLVFVPGASGLAINHALAYGRPYATFKEAAHGPEISYLNSGVNGYILEGDYLKDNNVLRAHFTNFSPSIYERSFQSGQHLTIENWGRLFIAGLMDSESEKA